MIESGQHGIFNIESDDVRKRHLNIDTDGGSMPGVNIIKLLFSMTLRQKKNRTRCSLSCFLHLQDVNLRAL